MKRRTSRFHDAMTPHLSGLLRPTPPPLWFVTNGQALVGPVTTNLLLRGVAARRVPEDCLVRERRWSAWRMLDGVREVARLQRDMRHFGPVEVEQTRYREPGAVADPAMCLLEHRLEHSRDPMEALQLALFAAVQETGALVGAVHRRCGQHPGLITLAATGPGMTRSVGQLVYADDPALLLAGEGRSLFGEPMDLPAMIVQDRLGALQASAGVAMVPVLASGRLYATIELGRPDHAFREGDVRRVAKIVAVLAGRLGLVRNPTRSSAGTPPRHESPTLH